MSIVKIISGGQTGADLGALDAGVKLGLKTGGWMPLGFRTDEGPRPDMKLKYNMMEHFSESYSPRTKLNVQNSDGTLIFGNSKSPGCRLTKTFCIDYFKPSFQISWSKKHLLPLDESDKFINWLVRYEIKVLNVAGNRERTNPGIHDAVYDFLLKILSERFTDNDC